MKSHLEFEGLVVNFFFPDKDRSLSCECSSTSKKWRSGILNSQHVFLSKKDT